MFGYTQQNEFLKNVFEGEGAGHFRTLVMFNKFLVLGIQLLLADPPGNNV